MKHTRWILAILLVIMVGEVRAADDVKVLALEGTVMAVLHNQATPVQEGDTLRAGTEVHVARNASLAVLLPDNQIKSILGPADWTVPEDQVRGEAKVTDKLADLLLKRKGAKGSMQLAVRAKKGRGMALPLLVNPPPFEELQLVEDDPLLEWVPLEGVQEYRVSLAAVNGEEHTLETTKTTLPFSRVNGQPMQAGTSYRWTVQAVGLEGSSVTVTFSLLPDEERRELGEQIRALRDIEDPMLRNRLVARLFFHRGLFGELHKMVQSLGPEAIEPEIRQVLRHRYLSVQGVDAIGAWVN